MAESSNKEKSFLNLALPPGLHRQELDRLLDPDFVDQLGIRAYDMIGKLPGFEIIAIGDLSRKEFRCLQFVLATTKREPWAKEDEYIPAFEDPLSFFKEKGFKLLEEGEIPKTGDVITYGFLQNSPLFRLAHTGIIDGASVISKFNEGHVFRHPLQSVPHHFGTNALFFKK